MVGGNETKRIIGNEGKITATQRKTQINSKGGGGSIAGQVIDNCRVDRYKGMRTEEKKIRDPSIDRAGR